MEGVPVKKGFSLWERGRENGSFTVEEGNEVKDRVLETVGFQGANPICEGGGRTKYHLTSDVIKSVKID
jgi:hypothetical protein